MGDMLIMSQRERKRKMILEEVLKGRLRLCDAALKLEVSYRQAKRLKAAYRRAGDKGLVHKNRGKKGNRCYSDEFKAKTLAIYKQKYQGFCATFASEKLEEFDNITVHPETLRRWLLAANLITRQRKGNPHRQKCIITICDSPAKYPRVSCLINRRASASYSHV
jgi:transposase